MLARVCASVAFVARSMCASSAQIQLTRVYFQLHDDDEHTLDFAMETLEGVLRREAVGIVRRSKVQWIAYQAHHYGRGLVAVLPELRAQRAVRDLEQAGLACSLVPG